MPEGTKRAMEHDKRTENKKKTTKIVVLCCVAVIIVTAGILIGSRLSNIIFDQNDLFLTATPKPVDTVDLTPQPGDVQVPATAEPGDVVTAEPTPTVDPYTELLGMADTSMMQNIVNVLIIGVDYEDARVDGTINGKGGNAFHSDVMMLLAVNFDEKRVDLISIPRDTYGKIPDVDGIYKLNASLNCGTDGTNYGIYAEHGEGFLKVCETAEWMLGGIPVDYYYAVTMPAVKQLIDTIGGVWYDLEGDFDNGGRYYKAGYQLMSGQACLDYMRVRKGGHGTLATGDANRVNRQKKMMVALFQSMKDQNLILKLPEMLQAFDGQVFTNCTIEQTAALAAFAYNLDGGNIGMYSFSGSGATLFHWNFVFTDQSNRVEIIKNVYGVDVSGYSQYTLKYARYRWADMLESRYTKLCAPLTSFVQAKIDEDNLLPEFTPEPTETPSPVPTETPTTAPETPEPTTAPTTEPTTVATDPVSGTSWHFDTETPSFVRLSASALRGEGDEVQTRKYTPEQRQQFADYLTCLNDLASIKASADSEAKKARNGSGNSLSSVASSYLDKLAELQAKAIALAATFGYSADGFSVACSPFATYKGSSAWSINYWNNKDINQIRVNFN